MEALLAGIDWGNVGPAIATGVIGLVTTLLALKRRASRDKVELVKDRAEESIINHLEKQRDKAMEDVGKMQVKMMVLETEKNDAYQRVSKLTNEMQHLTSQVRILKDLVERLGNNLDETRIEMQSYMTENVRLHTKVELLEERLKNAK